jgi:23S rRNA pseudouridine1911/1915/1917 synthase
MSDATPAPEQRHGRDTIVVPEDLMRLRLDLALARLFPEHSRGYFQRCIHQGRIRLNGRPAQPKTPVMPGNRIEIHWPVEEVYDLVPEHVAFDVLAEDRDVIVINKPPGLVVHPSDSHRSGTLVHGLLDYDFESFRAMVDENMRPGIVHRLDMDTSGAMVVARNLFARQQLKNAFKERLTEKTYVAIVIGEFGAVTGTVETQIGRHPVARMKMAVVEDGGKYALTKYRVLGTSSGCSLLEIRIFTGRTHQIRVHVSHLHHPILGDQVYGGCGRHAPITVPRQMLHAWKLVFPHPRTGVMRQFMAPIPTDFRNALSQLGLPILNGMPEPNGPTIPADWLPPNDLPNDDEDDEQ